MSSPARTLIQMARRGIRARRRFYKREFDGLLEPLPWWARPYAYGVLWDALKPRLGRIPKRWRRYRDYATVRSEVLAVLDRADPGIIRTCPSKHRKWPWTVVVGLRIRDGIADVHPVLADFLALGWEVDRISDDNVGRDWKMERDDVAVDLLVSAWASSADGCRIVERKVVKEETEYEMICEGEAELVGVPSERS